MPAVRSRPAIVKAQARVLKWYAANGRTFPWRGQREPYPTLVAEVMLQQTQTGRVGPIYEEFLKKFPTLERLAHAPAMDVIKAWKGLGYNRRAVDLQRAAHQIATKHGGVFPTSQKDLRGLPGVGEYSAGALACFAFDAQVPVIDVNVKRVLARAALGKDPDRVENAVINKTAIAWLPDGEAYRWNQALMDIGATFCRAGTPLCARCPLRATCGYHASGAPAAKRAPTPPKQAAFEGSNRQKRGGIIDQLRESAQSGLTLATLARAIHREEPSRDLFWLVELLEGLESDGLVTLTDAARRASPRGLVRLPS